MKEGNIFIFNKKFILPLKKIMYHTFHLLKTTKKIQNLFHASLFKKSKIQHASYFGIDIKEIMDPKVQKFNISASKYHLNRDQDGYTKRLWH